MFPQHCRTPGRLACRRLTPGWTLGGRDVSGALRDSQSSWKDISNGVRAAGFATYTSSVLPIRLSFKDALALTTQNNWLNRRYSISPTANRSSPTRSWSVKRGVTEVLAELCHQFLLE